MVRETSKAATESRPVRMCDVCGGVDDHPRHVFAYAPPPANEPEPPGRTRNEIGAQALDVAQGLGADAVASIIGHIRDDSTVMRHMDCCREVGCPDGTCNRVTAGAEDKRGDALVKHLTSLTPEG